METLQFKKGYINNEILRKSFEDFALKTFDVHYGAWHEDGLWNEKSNYINYSYFNDNEIAANVSVNEFTLIVEGEEKHAVQLGAVMTKEKYRNKNLIKTLMEKIFEDYAGKADFFYLFGHEGVLDFYTKFGFKRTKMNSFKINSQDVCHKKAVLRKLNVEKDWPLIDELTDGRVPVSKTLGIINDQWPLQVFDGITFQIYYGEKVGIVGINGCGKSTLLKVIAGIHEITSHDKGGVFVPRGASVGYLEQVMPDKSGKKVIDVLHEAFEEVAQIESELRSMEEKMKSIKGEELERVFRNYSILQEKYETKGGYDREEKLSKVCIGLNINDSFLNRDFNLLSGGEKTTVMLGKILLQSPDILLLDEPTNHLDMKSVEWLEGYLKSYKGMVLIVSHDRYFLDNVVGKIIEIEDMQNKVYKGNYSSYVKQREENMIKQFEDFKEQQKKIKAMENAIKKLRDWAVRADNEKFFKRAASMQKALDKIERIDKPKFEHDNMKLNFKETGRSGKDVIKVKDLCKSFDDKELFKDAEMMIYFQERAALIGSNGCGKTTFLKMLLGEDEDFTGELKLGESVKAAYLPQNITFTDEEATVLEDFREDFEILEGKAREYLAKFMFYGGTVFRKVKHLSGGERIRLKLSKLLYNDINLLILDEPTNHLDIESIENLETALENFKGTIFFISHDRYFINFNRRNTWFR